MLLDRLVQYAHATSATTIVRAEQDYQEQEALQGDSALIHCLEELNSLRLALQKGDPQG